MQQNSNLKLIRDLIELLISHNGFNIKTTNMINDCFVEIKCENHRNDSITIEILMHSNFKFMLQFKLVDTLLLSIFIVDETVYMNMNINSDSKIVYIFDFFKEPVFFMKEIIKLFCLNHNSHISYIDILSRINSYDFYIRDDKIKSLLKDV